VPDRPSLYQIPLLLAEQGLVDILKRRLNLLPPAMNPNAGLMDRWAKLSERCVPKAV